MVYLILIGSLQIKKKGVSQIKKKQIIQTVVFKRDMGSTHRNPFPLSFPNLPHNVWHLLVFLTYKQTPGVQLHAVTKNSLTSLSLC